MMIIQKVPFANLAIINALKTLQDRVGRLEGEKSAAQQKIDSLERELSTTKKLLFLQQEQQNREGKLLPI